METLSLEHQVQSVQRHIAFLEKEQRSLLHGLHLEILRLQKLCTELTHDLKTKELEVSHQEAAEEALEERCRGLQAQLEEKEEGRLELRKELRHKESLVAALRSGLRSRERKFLEELKRRSHRATVLNTELQKQAEAAAYLSFQLHATKQELHGSPRPPPDRPPERGALLPQPQPTRQARPKKRTQQKSPPRRQAAGSFPGKGGPSKDPSSRHPLGSRCEDAEPMPDPALFLYTKWHHAPKAPSKGGAEQKEPPAPHGLPARPPRSQRRGHPRASQEPAGPTRSSSSSSSRRTLGKPRPSSQGGQCKGEGASPHREQDPE